MAIYFDNSIAEYHFYYGCALWMLGKQRKAATALNKALTLKPDDAGILTELGHVYYKLGYTVRAKGYFERALKLNPSSKRARLGMEMLSGP